MLLAAQIAIATPGEKIPEAGGIRLRGGECLSNEQKQSGVCGQPCEVYSRVCGYMRPVKQWNPGKRAEYARRLVFRAPTEEARASEQDDDINKAIDRRFEGTPGY